MKNSQKSISDLLSGYDTLFVFRKLAYLKEKIHEKSVEVGDTHRDFSKSMAKSLPLVVVLGMSLAKFQYSS